jgi:penicillin-insensitive murein endopeptidase
VSSPRRWLPLALLAFALIFPARADAAGRAAAAAKPPAAASAKDNKTKKGARAKLEPKRPALSVGHPNDGRLEGGARLDTKLPYVRVVPAYASGDVRWGLPALVGMVERAARVVAKRYPGSIMNVGDLSLREGGDVLRHHSHESGRDVDVGFYVVDAKGKPALGHDFLEVGPDLAAVKVPGARFDLARNWLFLQTILEDPRAHVSHVFVSAELRRRLLDHGKKLRAPKALLERAAFALMQPSDSIEHDDHFHVRISCPRAMGKVCVERSKELDAVGAKAPRDAKHAKHAKARPALRTPAKKAAKAQATTIAAHPAEDGAAKVARADDAAPASERAPAARPDPARSLSRYAPLDAEAEADAFEVKRGLDDSGVVKITE